MPRISLYKLFCLGALLILSFNSAGQICSGSWATGPSYNYGCVIGRLIGVTSSPDPIGCPVNPIYAPIETNTFTFDNPVGGFTIDFTAFTTASGCGRMEIKINNIFYPLTSANLVELPTTLNCQGFYSFIKLTNDGYITTTSNALIYSNGQGRIIITNVNANSVTVSTNDAAGTVVSAPYNCTGVVPLNLINFTATANSCRANLNWETGTEQNINNIEIERSSDGISFYKVGSMNSKGSNSLYSFEITNNSNSYYRLKINDLDGRYVYSKIIYLKSSCQANLYSIISNPANNYIEILGLKSTNQIIISDMSGRILKKLYSTQSPKINLQTLPSGMYIVNIYNNNVHSATVKLVKN